MKKIITTVILAGSLMSIFGATALSATENESKTIDQKAKAIVHDANVKADKLLEDAKAKAKALVKKAEKDVEALKAASVISAKETTAETKALANEALAKAKTKSNTLTEQTKATAQTVTNKIKNNYVYTKEAVNESYDKGKDTVNDLLIHSAIKYAFLMSPEIHSTKIDVDVNNGVVELFGKVKSAQEAQTAMRIALSTKGVWAVKAFFAITE